MCFFCWSVTPHSIRLFIHCPHWAHWIFKYALFRLANILRRSLYSRGPKNGPIRPVFFFVLQSPSSPDFRRCFPVSRLAQFRFVYFGLGNLYARVKEKKSKPNLCLPLFRSVFNINLIWKLYFRTRTLGLLGVPGLLIRFVSFCFVNESTQVPKDDIADPNCVGRAVGPVWILLFFSPIRLTGQNNYPNMETMKCRIGIFFRWSADKAWMKRWGHKSALVRWWLHAAVDGYILWCRCLSRDLVPNFAHSWKSWMNSLGTFYRSCDICANS